MSARNSPSELLRQLLALLEGERQALAALDLERILTCATGKVELAEQIGLHGQSSYDEEALGLLDAANRLNEVNRKMRNLIASNIEVKLSSLTGQVGTYSGARHLSMGEYPAR